MDPSIGPQLSDPLRSTQQYFNTGCPRKAGNRALKCDSVEAEEGFEKWVLVKDDGITGGHVFRRDG